MINFAAPFVMNIFEFATLNIYVNRSSVYFILQKDALLRTSKYYRSLYLAAYDSKGQLILYIFYVDEVIKNVMYHNLIGGSANTIS